jgi:superfamily II DNA or RNA helicase
VHTTAGGLDLSIQDVFRLLVEDRDRTAVICEDVTRALEDGHHCLILSQWRRHCRAIHECLAGTGREVELLDGSLSPKEAKAALTRVRDHPADRPLAVVATGQLLGEGFDCPSIDTLFLAFPIAFKGRVVQYAGRLLREAADKSTVRIFDYVDADVPVLRRMHAKRDATYRALGFGERTPARP